MELSLGHLVTENRNPNTMNIDRVGALEIVQMINNEDKLVALAVEKELPQIAKAVDIIAEKLSAGGHLYYCGAGTSGRIGILDASECPPTYGTDPSVVVGLIAGGYPAIFNAIEGSEDDENACEAQLKEHAFSDKDVLVGIAASGRTPYVIGGMKYARAVGAPVISVTCNPDSAMVKFADVSIAPVVGPEVVTGSTRMKAGTAQKMVCNMLTTASMVRMGKTYENLLVNMQCTNEKLVERAGRMIVSATGVELSEAKAKLIESGYAPKVAITMIMGKISASEAEALLKRAGGRIRDALDLL